MKKMLIYDGEKHIKIFGKEIDQLSPDKLVEVFKSTAEIVELIKDLSPSIKAGTVTGVCGHSVDENYSDEIFDGFVTLRMQLDFVFGEDSAFEISNKIITNLKTK